MIKLDKLPKTTKRKKKRVGRGYGSGKGGHTSGRGAKGLKARGKVGLTFEGTKTKKSFIKKLPLQRGKGRFKSLKPKPLVVNLKYLNLFKKGEKVNLTTLAKKRIITSDKAEKQGVKILGDGDLNVALTIELPASKGATKKIEKAGGKVVEVEKQPKANRLKSKPAKKKKTKPVKTQKEAAKKKKEITKVNKKEVKR
ncbi:MAG TPA: 50S ribosomal protein L15 [Patescibacteria group bacterium]|nr:50S ribosomal protein L15 [Patescibacteria group bacterium]